jgi:hypothetical protein
LPFPEQGVGQCFGVRMSRASNPLYQFIILRPCFTVQVFSLLISAVRLHYTEGDNNRLTKQFIEFAVNIPEQEPHPGHANLQLCNSYLSFSLLIGTNCLNFGFITMWLIFTSLLCRTGPNDTKIVGILQRGRAIAFPAQSLCNWVTNHPSQ